ncbi:MAG: alpha/beta hydrolase [Solirubrobacteraceae bacterium]
MGVTFALVHGAWHGPWCWERLFEPLRERGLGGVAVDLPCEDPDAGLEACAAAICAALDGVDDEVVLVGHSLGGLPLSLVPARRPVRRIVYLSAFVPLAGQSMADQFASSPDPILLFDAGLREIDEMGRSRWVDAEATLPVMYGDLCEQDARWAFARLRAQGSRSQVEPHPAALPAVPVTSLVCGDDRIVNPAWSRRVARERLGVEPVELATGHFPMISAPEALAEALAAEAR